MGEWRRVAPHGELSAPVVLAAVGGASLLAYTGLVVTQPGRVVSWSGIAFGFLFLVAFTTVTWRAARAGVHIGPRGLLLYGPISRAEVVPWDEVVRFEARATTHRRGAVIYLVDSAGDLRETALKHATGPNRHRAWGTFDAVLDQADFTAALDRLNQAIRPHTTPDTTW